MNTTKRELRSSKMLRSYVLDKFAVAELDLPSRGEN